MEFVPASKNTLCGHLEIVKKYPLTSYVLAFVEVALRRMPHLIRLNSSSMGHSRRDTKPSSMVQFAGHWLPCVPIRLSYTHCLPFQLSQSPFFTLFTPQFQDFCMGQGTENRLMEAQHCHYSTIPREMLLQNHLPLELIRRMSSDRTPGLVTSLSTSSKSRDMQQTAFLIITENPLDFLPQLMRGLLEVQHHF